MKSTLIGIAAMALSAGTAAQAVDSEADAFGAAPARWTCGVTGKGIPRWTGAADASAPSKGKVLQRPDEGLFPSLGALS